MGSAHAGDARLGSEGDRQQGSDLDGVPFLVKLTMMVTTQYAVGKALRRQERYDAP